MKKLIIILAFWFTALASPLVANSQELYVVVNKQNPLSSISKQQVTDLFMGRAPYFPSGAAVLKLDAPGGSALRANFYKALVNMTLPEVNAYWARLMFSGRATPPMQVASEPDMVQLIEQNPNAIGYIAAGSENENIKILFVIPKAE
ncbi:hypothetical protein JYB87_02760 [Shewanella avicenniae]|uniref:Phosphate ABC transporter substrate-binding protein n=1 Tax=Shewanella avicenniae TaxID=2814294 RepID=A0ABX7QRW5_9GAMM|nr:hypothetical protein [Shewanella avicenniae]QSX34187.1 hypothetical protein JYB87_02760 [Shewanella avicenniae]